MPISPIRGQVMLSSAIEDAALAGTTAIACFTATDPGATADMFTAIIDWGDGTSSPGTVVGANGAFTVEGGHSYADEGDYALRIVITNAGTVATLDGVVTVAENDVLTAQPGITIAATQGSAFSGVVASFTDSDLVSPASDFAATIDWGDGTSSPGTVTGANGVFTVSGTHSYAIVGQLPVQVTLADDAPGTATAVATGSALVVSPAALSLIDPLYGSVAAILGPFFQGFINVTDAQIGLATTIQATEDVALTDFPVAAFIDSNPADTAADFIALIHWGDGTTTQGTVTLAGSQDFDPAPGFVPPLHAAAFVVSGSHTYADASADEPLSVGIIRTTDNLSGTLNRSATVDFAHASIVAGVTVAEADVLAPVTLAPIAANPNTFQGVVARFTDVNLAATAIDFTASIDWGDGTAPTIGTVAGANGTFTVSDTHSYANSGHYSVTVSLADDDGGASATVQRDAFIGLPLAGEVTLSAATEHVALAGTTAIASFTAADPSAPASAFTATIDWGDGTSSPGTVVGANGAFTVEAGHSYADEGHYALHATITTSQSAASLDGVVTVAENDVLTAQPGITIQATQGSAFSGVVASFTDSDLVSPAGDFAATIDWGDGTSSPGTVTGANGVFTVSGTHSYAIAGELPVQVTLADDAPGTATAVATGSALVVSPDALSLIDPLYGSVAAILGPAFQGFINVTDAQIGLATTIHATEDVALTDVPVAAFIDSNPADTAADFIALIHWGDGTTTQGTVTLAGSQDFDPAPGFVPPLHAAAFVISGSHTYADESADEPLSVGIIRTTDNLSGTLSRSATVDFAHASIVAGVTVAEADVLASVPLTIQATQSTAFSGVVARFTDVNLAATASDFTASIDWGDGTAPTIGTVAGANGTFTVSGTHSYAVAGQLPVAVTLADDAPGTATATAVSTADVSAPSPVANCDSYTGPHDQTLHVAAAQGVLVNDNSGSPLTAVLDTGPTVGSLTLNPDGSFDYTPPAGFLGTASFTYIAGDSSQSSTPATVQINVVDPHAPTGHSDFYDVLHDNTLHVAGPGVLGNDADADGDPITAAVGNGPQHGGLTLHADGSFDYTPVAGFAGDDSFTYRVGDGALTSTPVTVALSVLDHAPVSIDVSIFTTEDSPVASVGQLTAVSSDPDGDPLTFILVDGPTHGSLEVFESWDGFVYRPSPDFFGSDSFTYKANDGILDGNVATLFITVLPINDAPVATNDSLVTDEDVALVIPAPGILANDSDVENDPLSAVLVASPSHGALALNGDGSFTYTPDADYNGSDSFTYKASDGALDSNTATVNLAVTAVNDAPAGADRTITALEDSTFTFGVADFGFSDPNDTPANALRAVEIATLPTAGALTDNGVAVTAGQFISVADIAGGHLRFAPASNASGNGYASFTFQVQDDGGTGGGGVDLDPTPNRITVNVTPVNDAPVITSGGGGDAASYFVRVNNTAITTLAATDVDPGNVATFSIVGGADAGRFVIDANTGALSFRSLPAQPHNAYQLQVQASDGHGGADVQSLTVNVTAAMMVGDAAADTFVFHEKFGSNEVKNFDLDHDFLQFDRGMFAGDTAAAVLAAAHDQKGGVVIDAHAGHLVIDNVTLAQLQAHANDFLFV